MKKLYGLIVLLLNNIATLFLIWQIFYYEKINILAKIIIGVILIFIMAFIDLKSIQSLNKRVKQSLPPKKREKALKKLRQKKYITNLLLTILCVCLVGGNYFYFLANKTISTITLSLEPTELKTYIMVKEDSDIKDVNDENLITMGFDITQDHYQSLFENVLIEEFDKYAYQDYQPIHANTTELYGKFMNEELHALFVSEDTYEKMQNEHPQFKNEIRILNSHTIKTKVASKNVNMSKEPFNVLILGVDVREGEGDIHSNTRTDTIMVASFNPKTMQASLISVPRDSYVPLSHDDEYDKLTHAATYGLGCTIETIENLLDIKLNYYAKFNFKALVGLVDALGGIEVDVKFDFYESNSDDTGGVNVKKGLQILDGEKALAYARHRNTQNDHVRNNSQQEVLKAILTKLASFDTVTKINPLLNVLNTNMTTNLERENFIELIGIIPKLSELQMTTYVIEGEDYEEYVPKFDEYLWITDLSDESISKAKQQIDTVFKGVDSID